MITDWSILSSRDDTQPALSNDSWLPQRSRRITHLRHTHILFVSVHSCQMAADYKPPSLYIHLMFFFFFWLVVIVWRSHDWPPEPDLDGVQLHMWPPEAEQAASRSITKSGHEPGYLLRCSGREKTVLCLCILPVIKTWTSIHFLPFNPSVGSRVGWSLSQQSSGERRGTAWTDRQSITGPHRDKRDKQPCTRLLLESL